MPELADAEKAKKKLEETSRGATITKVELPAGDDPIVFDGVDGETFRKAVEGKKVTGVGRKGKYFYMTLDEAPHVLFHFGMTGTSQVRGKVEAAYYRGSSAHKRDAEPEAEWPPKHCKLVLSFTRPRSATTTSAESASPYFASSSKGAGKKSDETVTEEWAFSDARRFGRIVLKESHPLECEPLVSMGRDTLIDMPEVEEVRDLIRKRNAPIKAVLMDQRGPFCGLGNWMCDEICWAARLHPDHPAPLLTDAELATLVEKVGYVSFEAVKAEGKEERFPKGWLFSSRWGKGRGGEELVLADGSTAKIEWITVGGRTTALVPSLQKLPEGVTRKTPKKRKVSVMDGEAVADSEDQSPISSPSKKSPKTPSRSRGTSSPVKSADESSTRKRSKLSETPTTVVTVTEEVIEEKVGSASRVKAKTSVRLETSTRRRSKRHSQ